MFKKDGTCWSLAARECRMLAVAASRGEADGDEPKACARGGKRNGAAAVEAEGGCVAGE